MRKRNLKYKPENKTGVYTIYSKWQDKYYIGYSINIKRRIGDHICQLRKNTHRNHYLQNSWNKYDSNNFVFTVHCYCPNKEEAASIEEELIKETEKEKLFNISTGGLCPEPSEETKLKMSKSAMGRKKSESTKRKIAIGNKGKVVPNESILKMSDTWAIIYPNGIRKVITNLKQFCKENNSSSSHLYVVSSGKRIQHKGFRCKKLIVDTG